MTDWPAIFAAVTSDPRYLSALDWGTPRAGHPEGTIRAHIAELERNLDALRPHLRSDDDVWKLRLLIHTHDTFKGAAAEGVSIRDPRSHASLARAFLAEHTADADLLAMVQLHDEPYALYLQEKRRGALDVRRFDALLAAIGDWDLFCAFLLIDGSTAGKSREPLRWFFARIDGKTPTRLTGTEIP